MTDTHTHLYLFGLPEFDRMPGMAPVESPGLSTSEGNEACQRAMDAGIRRLVFPAVDSITLPAMLDLKEKRGDSVALALGLHPTSVWEGWRDELDQMWEMAKDFKISAIGEVGIDLYWDSTWRDQQIKVFEHQTEMSLDKNLPLIIHCREGLDLTLDILRNAGGKARGVFHCFTDGPAEVDKIRARAGDDFYFGIGGVATFKNARNLREALHEITPERILLETDSPYLAPVPHRGKRNESSFLRNILDVAATELQMETRRLEDITDANATKLFNLKDAS